MYLLIIIVNKLSHNIISFLSCHPDQNVSSTCTISLNLCLRQRFVKENHKMGKVHFSNVLVIVFFLTTSICRGKWEKFNLIFYVKK